MKLSIIIPVFNEEKTIHTVLNKLTKLKLPCKKEIIVVNDGSMDGTKEKIESFCKATPRRTARHGLITTIIHKKNLGKGAAIRSGIEKATGDYILIQDADLEYNPDEIPKLIHPISKLVKLDQLDQSFCPAVYGSRFMSKGAVIPLLYGLGNKFLTVLTNILYGTKLTDMETGYKLLPAKIIKSYDLKSRRFNIEPEITAWLIKTKVPIIEIPISYRGRSHLAGKKLTVTDAFDAIRTLVYMRYFR